MAEPLEYFTPKSRDTRPADRAPEPPAAAIPVEFDAVLTRTGELAAVRAVERELARHGIRFFRTEGPGTADRLIELHVASADEPRAAPLAAMIFARRQRLNRIAPRPTPPRDVTSDGSDWRGPSDA